MKAPRIEIFPVLILITTIVLNLLGIHWINPIIYIDLLILLVLWIIGYSKRETVKDLIRLTRREFTERIFIFIILLGVAFNITNVPLSNLVISLGILLNIGFIVFRAINNLRKKNVLEGIEKFIVGAVLFGYLLRFRHFPGASITIVVSSYLLSLSYIVLGILSLSKSIKANSILIGMVSFLLYLGISVTILGLLFDFFYWPNSTIILIISLIITISGVMMLGLDGMAKAKLDGQIYLTLNRLFKNVVIVTTIGLFFLFSSPKQNIRLDLGNRPQFIKASYDCRINQNLSDSEKEAACEEYQLLKEMDIFGYYPEGLSDTEDNTPRK